MEQYVVSYSTGHESHWYKSEPFAEREYADNFAAKVRATGGRALVATKTQHASACTGDLLNPAAVDLVEARWIASFAESM